MIGVAVAGLALSVGTFAYGVVEKNKAEKEAEARQDAMGDPTNPFSSLKPSTYGASLNTTQSLRSMATQTQHLADAGSRGMAYMPQASRQNALVSRQAAADLDRQQMGINQQIAQGDVYRQGVEENRYLQEMGGYAQQYNYGQNMMMQGINQGMGVLASGLAPGGAFTQQGSTYRPATSGAYNYNQPTTQSDYATINPPMSMPASLVAQNYNG